MQLSRRQIIAYVAVAVVVVAVGVRYVVLPRQAGPSEAQAVVLAPVAASASPTGAEPPASPAGSAARRRPTSWCTSAAPCARPAWCGSPAGARVTDALELAGGPTAKAELAAVNLAAQVTDGQQILVPERGAAVASAPSSSGSSSSGALGVAPAGGATPGALININTASLEELDALDGVGPSTAQKIIDYRTENGGFKTVDEIKEVPGIGDAKFAAMKDSITV